MDTAATLEHLATLLRANNFTAARAYIKKIFSSLDEDMKGKVLLAVYSAALEEIRLKKEMHELRRAGLAALDKLDAMPDEQIINFSAQSEDK